MNIHYHKKTGQIMMFDQSEKPDLNESPYLDHLIVFKLADDDHTITINAKTQKIDVLTEDLIDKAWDEQAHAHMPVILEIQHYVALELLHTDSYETPSRQKRMGQELATKWINYREKLRDLSKLKTAQAMIEAWPVRPNGDDAIPRLREAVTESILLKSLAESHS